jgi:bacteriocin-like protein
MKELTNEEMMAVNGGTPCHDLEVAIAITAILDPFGAAFLIGIYIGSGCLDME